MRTIGKLEFPETLEEANDWSPYVAVTPLHQQVLTMARTRVEGTWSAYVFPVDGLDHLSEAKEWRVEGSKLPEAVARAIFPELDLVPYAS